LKADPELREGELLLGVLLLGEVRFGMDDRRALAPVPRPACAPPVLDRPR